MATDVQVRRDTSPANAMVKLRGDLLRALETQGAKTQGIIDKRHVLIACQQIEANHALLRCSPASIFREIVKAGLYGWVCDGVLGQGYLVPFGGEAALIAGYKGLRDLVRRSGQADTVMEAVREGDTFEFRGIFQEPVHIKSIAKDRSDKPVVGAYVIVYYFTTKSVKTFWWPVADIIAHRDRYSIGWKKKGGPDSPWHEKNAAFPVMCMKTVLRAVINRGEAPVSLEDRSILRDTDEEPALEAMSQPSVSVLSDVPLIPDEPEAATVETPKQDTQPQPGPTRREEYLMAIDGMDDADSIGKKVGEALADSQLSDADKKAIEEHGKKRAGRGPRTVKSKAQTLPGTE